MKARWYRFLFSTLHGRLILSVALVHAVLMTLLLADLTARQRALLLERQSEEAATISQTLAASAAGWLVAADVSGLQELVEAQHRYPGVQFAILVDEHGRVLADTDPSRLGLYMLDLPREARPITFSRSHALVDVATPAMIGDRQVGWARVGIGERATGEKLAEITRDGVVYALAAILIGSAAAWFLGRHVTRRLNAVQKTIDAVRAGDRAARTSLTGEDEAAVIAREFNDMLDALAERDMAMRASEERYRRVFENSPVSLWEEDFSAVGSLFDEWRREGVTDLAAHFRQHPERVRQCAERVRIVDVNRAALALHGASSKEELLAGLVQTFTPESFKTFERELVCLWNGTTAMTSDAVVKTLAGEPRDVTIQFSVSPGEEGALSRVVVSLVDITERKRSEQQLTLLSFALNNVNEMAGLVDEKARFLFVNEQSSRLLGYSSEELRAMTVLDIAPGWTEELWDAHWRELRDKGSFTGEFDHRHKDGSLVPVEVRANYFEFGGVGYNLALVRDITERKQAEAALLRINRELRAISDCNQTLVRAENESSLLQEICTIVCEKAGYRMAWVGYLEYGDTKCLRAVAWAGAEEGFFEEAGFTWNDTEHERCASGIAVRTGEIAGVDDFVTEPGEVPWREAALRRGYRSCIVLPLKDENAVTFGVFGIYATEPRAFNAEERRLLAELAGDLAFGIVTLRTRAARDIAEQEIQIAATAFEAQEGIVITDADQVILRVNRAFSEISGYAPEDVVGKTPRLLASGLHDAPFYQAMWRRIAEEGCWQGEIWNRRKNGEVYPEWLNVTAVKNARGEVTHYVGTLNDITERKAAERKIEHLAFYDLLTELPNRRLFMDRLQQALAVSTRSRHMGALLFIDLDNFKIINDTCGHDAGDKLLIEVARRLRASMRDGDTIARLGGDEFVVMLEGLSETPQDAAAQAKGVAEKVRGVLNQPYNIDGRVHHSTPSIGATLFVDGRTSAEDVLKQADIAMYQAKSAGRNTVRFFDPEMQAVLAARADLEASLRQAIQEQRLTLHYQPQVAAGGRVVGAEALLRWQHPELGMVSPAQFVPLAEETDLILPIGQWVLENACERLNAWSRDPRTRDLDLAINVSARQFRQEEFVERVRQVLERTHAPARHLKLELTESLVLDDVEDTIRKLQELKKLGVGFSMDDFGTGYSSLSYLTRLPLDQLKIDQSFVRDLPHNLNDAMVVQTIITLARSLGLAVIAEGVETEAQRQFLERHGCPVYQGYLFSRPVSLTAFEELLARKALA